MPAIPRSLERKPRQTTSKPASPPVRAKADTEALKAAAATQAQTLPNADDGEVDLEDDADVEKVGVGMKCNPEVQAKATESDAGPEEEIESTSTFQSAAFTM